MSHVDTLHPLPERKIIEQYVTAGGTRMDRLECGHKITSWTDLRLVGGKYRSVVLRPEFRRCKRCWNKENVS